MAPRHLSSLLPNKWPNSLHVRLWSVGTPLSPLSLRTPSNTARRRLAFEPRGDKDSYNFTYRLINPNQGSGFRRIPAGSSLIFSPSFHTQSSPTAMRGPKSGDNFNLFTWTPESGLRAAKRNDRCLSSTLPHPTRASSVSQRPRSHHESSLGLPSRREEQSGRSRGTLRTNPRSYQPSRANRAAMLVSISEPTVPLVIRQT